MRFRLSKGVKTARYRDKRSRPRYVIWRIISWHRLVKTRLNRAAKEIHQLTEARVIMDHSPLSRHPI